MPAPSRRRYQVAEQLWQEGLSVPSIARSMGVEEGAVRDYLFIARSKRGQTGPAAGEFGTELAESMARVYDDEERRSWIRREMARRDELIEHKRRRGLL